MLYHQSNLVVNGRYTNTGRFSHHVFAMCQLLGFTLGAAHPRSEGQATLYIATHQGAAGLASLVAGVINLRLITDHWSEFSICKYLIKLNEGSESSPRANTWAAVSD
ncbi:MAG: Tn3 family transposase [Steroidobacteraceae bacterium]